MGKKFLLLLPVLLASGFLAGPNNVKAYGDQTTHPALTDQIIDFYNTSFPGDQITPEEREWVIEGSKLEDTAPRWINHFYDPIYKKGWTGENAGRISQEAVRKFSSIAFGDPVSALEWIKNDSLQQSFAWYGGNRTWGRGLEHFAKGEEKEAFLTLGHILHILEDMGVPDHTRNDTHANTTNLGTGDEGSPYEDYATRWDRTTIKELNIPEDIRSKGLGASRRPDISDYLTAMAEYSNKYFFSKDTTSGSKYTLPQITREDENFAYSTDESNIEFKLARISNLKTGLDIKKLYLLDENSKEILFDYFTHLSRQIVLNGAGVIALFEAQAKDEKVKLEYEISGNPFKYAVSRPVHDFVVSINFSLGGMVGKTASFFSQQIAAVSGAIQNSAGFVAGIFKSSPETAPNPPPAQVALTSDEIPAPSDPEPAAPGPIPISVPSVSSSAPTLSFPEQGSPGFTGASSSSSNSGAMVNHSAGTATSSEPIINPSAPSQSSEPESMSSSMVRSEPELQSPRPIMIALRDTIPPSRIADLAVSTTSTSTATLSWTSPGDDGASGQAYQYVLKYSTSTITVDNWNDAVPTSEFLHPQINGRAESYAITNLTPGTTYYFGLVARDESPNDSAISNIASGTTLTEGPVISGFSAVYSSSTMSAEVRWNLSQNSGTSTYAYRLYDISTSTPGTLLFETTSTTSTSVLMSSARTFQFNIEDETGILASTSTAVSSDFYSYSGNIFVQNATSSRYNLNPDNTHSWAQTFRPQRTGRANNLGLSWTSDTAGNGMDYCTIKIYKASDPSGANDSNLVSTAHNYLGEENIGASCFSGSLGLSTSTLEAGETYTLVYTYRGPSTLTPGLLVSEDVIPGSFWFDSVPYANTDALLTLSGIVMSDEKFSAPPEAPASLAAVFDSSSLSVDLSWPAAADADSSSTALTYEINVSTSTSVDPAGWHLAGSALSTSTRVSYPDNYHFAVRARDEFYQLSSSTEADFSFPAGFSTSDTLVSQAEATNILALFNQDGTKTNRFAQTFAVSATSTPYSIRLKTTGTDNGTCSVKIYQAGDLASVSDGLRKASTDALTGDSCDYADGKDFNFTSTAQLSPGTTYIWVYVAQNGAASDGIVGGVRGEASYPGVFSRHRDGGSIETYAQDTNAYFILSGDLQ